MWKLWKVNFVLAVITTAAFAYDNPCDDPNAAPPPDGCSWNCNQQCSNYIYDRKDYCPRLQCPPTECGCKKGYYYDKNYKKCVLGEDCSCPQPE